MKKINAYIIISLLLLSLVTSAEEPAEVINPELEGFTGQIDKQSPQEYSAIKTFFANLFSGQLFSFVKPSSITQEKVGDNVCISLRASGTFDMYKGGLAQDGSTLTAGKVCNNGEYIKFIVRNPVTKNYDTIFQEFWLKSNDNDVIYFKDYEWTKSGIFNNYKTNVLQVKYYCYKCGTPIVSGCMNSEAINYNKNANKDDGSCKFSPCEEKGTYTVYKGAKNYHSCLSKTSSGYFACDNNELKLTTKYCTKDQECKDAVCVDKPKELIEAPPVQEVISQVDQAQPPVQESINLVNQAIPSTDLTTTSQTADATTAVAPPSFFAQYSTYIYATVGAVLLLLLVFIYQGTSPKKRRRT